MTIKRPHDTPTISRRCSVRQFITTRVTNVDIYNLGEIEQVDSRDIWPNEARDFTPWLAQNLERLSEILSFEMELVEIEAKVGSGFADITAKVVGNQARIIIENQLEETDNEHLARLLAYAATYDAEIVIWVATHFTLRIRQTLDWLNQNTSGPAFYGILLRTLKIDESRPAPLFDLVIKPTAIFTGAHKPNPNIAPGDERYRRFFQTIVDELSKQNLFEYAPVRSDESWFEFNTSLNDVTYVAAFTRRRTARVKLHIRCRIDSNHQIFEYLSERKQEIDDELGEPLSWEERSRGSQHRHLIGLYQPGSIDCHEDELSELNDWMIKKLSKLKQVFDPYLDDAAT